MNLSVPQATKAKWAQLVDHLIALTEENKLDWKETADDDQFMVRFGGFVISIERTEKMGQEEPEPFIEVAISDKSGREIDRFDDSDIGGFGKNYFVALKDLMSTINRRISGADAVLEELLGKMSAADEEIPF